MNWTTCIRNEFARLRKRVDDTVIEELSQHATDAYQAARAEGASQADAESKVFELLTAWCAATSGPRRTAREPLAESAPAIRGRWTGLGLDVRHALRLLWRQPGFTVVSIVMIALAIAATTSIFSVINGVVLKPLPFDSADGLVRVFDRGLSRPRSTHMSNLTYEAWSQPATTIQGLGGWWDRTMDLGGPGSVEKIQAALVTVNLFPLLGVAPALGANFTEADLPDGTRPLKPNFADPRELFGTVVMLSHGMWQERFGGAADVIGKTLTINRKPRTIVGVMPPDFSFPSIDVRVWLPLRVPTVYRQVQMSFGLSDAVEPFHFQALARLKPGVTPQQAATEATIRANAPRGRIDRYRDEIYGGDGAVRVAVVPLVEWSVQDVKPALWIMFAAVLLLFTAAIGNVANMQVARAATRRHEVAIRASLGAGRGRLARQLFVETVPVALVGGALGLVLTLSLVRALPVLLPDDFPRLKDIAIDRGVFVVAIGLTLVASIVTGLLPTRLARRMRLTQVLAEDGTTPAGPGSPASLGPRAHIISGQVAVAALLLVGAALLAQSFLKLVDADRGYEPANLLTARITPLGPRQAAARRLFNDDLRRHLRAIAGVAHAGLSDALPLTPAPLVGHVFDTTRPETRLEATIRAVSPDYFEAMGMRITRGRGFSDADGWGAEQVIVVNESFAARYLAGNPLGVRLSVPFHDRGDLSEPRHWWRVVGVVADVKNAEAGAPAEPEVFGTLNQFDAVPPSSLYLAVRTAGDPATLPVDLRTILTAAGAPAVVDQITTMEARLRRTLTRPRLYAALLAGFAAFALLVAGIGLFGGLACSVTQRTREIGLRTALGATPWRILAMVMKQGTAMTVIGLIVGFGVAAASVRFLGTLLFGVTPFDLQTYVAVAVAIFAVAVIACVIPALRAAKLDALTALRK